MNIMGTLIWVLSARPSTVAGSNFHFSTASMAGSLKGGIVRADNHRVPHHAVLVHHKREQYLAPNSALPHRRWIVWFRLILTRGGVSFVGTGAIGG